MSATLFTIGHSNHPIDLFVALLKQHNIACVADVRSAPVSKYNPQYNKDALAASLRNEGIDYIFLGKELGARSNDPSCYVDGKVQYDRLAQTALFQQGLDRLAESAQSQRVAMMCAEKDPLTCHRSILIAPRAIAKGLEIQHIREDATLESHDQALARLKGLLDIPDYDLFTPEEELTQLAYAKQAARIAYEQTEPQIPD